MNLTPDLVAIRRGECMVSSSAGRNVTAIVVSYFTGPLLARAIASLKAQPEVAEIIVVDNGNWRGAVEAAVDANEGGAPVAIISGQGNVGFATACNLGARRATGDYLLFLNPDAVMPRDGVARLLSDGAKMEHPWLQGAKLIDPDGAEQQGSRRMTLTPWRAFVEATRLYRFAPRHPYFRRFNLHGDPCPNEVTAVPVISGACLFTPREDYFSIGGMDEEYFLHVEDIDFCLRFRNNGGAVYFNPNVAVLHHKSSSRVDPMRVELRKTASLMRYFRQHFSDPYPAPFLWLVGVVLWSLLGLKFVARLFRQGRAFVGFSARRGSGAVKRALQMSARRSVR